MILSDHFETAPSSLDAPQMSEVVSRYTVPLDAVLQTQLAVECPDKSRFVVSDGIGAVVSVIQDVVNPLGQGDNFICPLISDFPAHEHKLILVEKVIACADSDGIIGAL